MPNDNDSRRYRRWSKRLGDVNVAEQADQVCVDVEDPEADRFGNDLESQGY